MTEQRTDPHAAHRAARRLALAAVFEADFGQRTAAYALDRQLNDLGIDDESASYARSLVDVVVCDASVGNVTMKFFEGLSGFIFDLLRGEFRRPPLGPMAYVLMRPGIARIRARFDYERTGGAPLLGVRGSVIITHGRARARMISYAVGVGADSARARVPQLIADALGPRERHSHRTTDDAEVTA